MPVRYHLVYDQAIDSWFVMLRGAEKLGPYNHQHEAQEALDNYTNKVMTDRRQRAKERKDYLSSLGIKATKRVRAPKQIATTCIIGDGLPANRVEQVKGLALWKVIVNCVEREELFNTHKEAKIFLDELLRRS